MNSFLLTYLNTKKDSVIRGLIKRLYTSEPIRAFFPAASLPEFIAQIWQCLIRSAENEKVSHEQLSLEPFFQKHPFLLGNNRELQIIINVVKSQIKNDLGQSSDLISELRETHQLLDAIFDELGMHILDLCATEPKKQASTEADKSHQPSRLNLFYNAFQGSTDGILITDLKTRIIEVNGAFLDIYGYTYDEVIGQRTSILRSSRTANSHYVAIWAEIKSKGSWAGQIINRHKDGQEIPVWLSITSIIERNKTVGYMGVEFDMRKQQELEKRIIQSERLAIIGQMAAKVAHEVRNPLSSISLNAELLGDELKCNADGVSAEGETLLKAIMDEVERVTNLTEDYLQFSRLPEADFHLVGLYELLEDTIDFVEPEANSQGIEIIREIESDLPKIAADFHQIRRVILNLMRNAFDAMKDGGVLRLHAVSAGENVEISVGDTGDGIPEEQKKKIFEPFFTTRDMGTGLGLAIAMQIVQEHGGRISFTSKENAGTIFTIVLPIQHKMIHQKEEMQARW
ncbi:MAG: PAS domain S-box protein [Calditrichaeota bacterium]|nr:MAG: PAS domain S-box protein [Calditrichota bacterium]